MMKSAVQTSPVLFAGLQPLGDIVERLANFLLYYRSPNQCQCFFTMRAIGEEGKGSGEAGRDHNVGGRDFFLIGLPKEK